MQKRKERRMLKLKGLNQQWDVTVPVQTCSFVVLPRATKTMWNPVRPATGTKNKPATHMTTILRAGWKVKVSKGWKTSKVKKEIRKNPIFYFYVIAIVIKDTSRQHVESPAAAGGVGQKPNQSQTHSQCEWWVTAGRGRSSGNSSDQCSCSPRDNGGQNPKGTRGREAKTIRTH